MVRAAQIRGVTGRRPIVAVIATAKVRVGCDRGNRHGVVPVRLLGAMVIAIAYERRK